MKVKSKIEPGICNFKTTVIAKTEDHQQVTFKFGSGCETIQVFAKEVAKISPVNAIMTLGPDENPILAIARGLLQAKGCCEACIVPAATVKVMQVAANLALPQDVSLSITKE